MCLALGKCALKRVSFAAVHLKVSARQSGIFLIMRRGEKNQHLCNLQGATSISFMPFAMFNLGSTLDIPKVDIQLIARLAQFKYRLTGKAVTHTQTVDRFRKTPEICATLHGCIA